MRRSIAEGPFDMKRLFVTVCAALLTLAVGRAEALPISWTDWMTTGPSVVGGTATVGATPVTVTFSGAYLFAQTGGGTNYWVPGAPYVSGAVDNAPPASDMIALNAGGAKTITFSQPVIDPILALVSWNGVTVDFGTPIQILSFGTGFWGSGTPVLNGGGTGFTGNGEVHGAIRLPGTFTSITFTDTAERWHGFTVGVTALPQVDPIPEPATLLLLGSGTALLARRLRTRPRR